MTERASPPFIWLAVIIAALALVPIAAMTLMVAAVAWIPLVAALAIVGIVLLVRSQRRV